MQIILSQRHAKRQARTLQTQLNNDGCGVAYSRCLEIVARMMGFDSYNALEAVLPATAAADGDLPPRLDEATVDQLEGELTRRGRLLLLIRSADILAEEFDTTADAVLDRAKSLRKAIDHSSIPEAFSEVAFAVLGDLISDEEGDDDTPGADDDEPGPPPVNPGPRYLDTLSAADAHTFRHALQEALSTLSRRDDRRPGWYAITVNLRDGVERATAIPARGYVMRTPDGTPAHVVTLLDRASGVFHTEGAVEFALAARTDAPDATEWFRVEAFLMAEAETARLTF